MGFTTDVGSSNCGCGANPTETQIVDGTPSGLSHFSQWIDDAAARDAQGTPVWGLDMSQSSSDMQSLEVNFTLYAPAGPYQYSATGTLVSVTKTDWGGWAYLFVGRYDFSSGTPEDYAEVPHRGRFEETLTASPDRVVSVSVAITEDAG
jgi:hypothetical protein